MTHAPHTPEKEIWTTGPLTGEVQSNVPQFEGQKAPYLVCYGIGNSEAAGLIANAPELWRLLNDAYYHLHSLEQENFGFHKDHELTALYKKIPTILFANEQPAPISPA